MDTRVCRYFVELCRHGSYSAAARELSMTPQGLNLAIRRLERELGVRLVDGRYGPIQPTDHGQALLECAEAMLETEQELGRRLEEITARQRGLIRLGGSIGVMGTELKRWIADFDGAVELLPEMPDAECEQSLIDGECDFAVIVDPCERPDLLHGVPVARDCHFVWVNRDNPLATRDALRVEDLEGQTIMSVNADYHNGPALLALISDAGVDCRVEFTSEMIKVYEFALANRGLGLTGRSHVDAIGSDRLVGLPFAQLPLSISLCYRADRELSDLEGRFVAHMGAYPIDRI